MAITEAAVLEALKSVRDPDLNRDIVSLKFIKNLKIDGGAVSFAIELTTPACPVKDQMRDQAQALVSAIPGVTSVAIEMTAQVRAAVSPDAAKAAVPGVKNIIAVGAGKGGVGKTTVAVNLAIALSQFGGRVAMIDGDVYGPNVPIMLGLHTQLTTDGQKIVPAEQYGIQVVSMGFLTGDDAPVIWRGPMLHGVIQQFFREVRWENIDYLIVDMPPGTGDVAISLGQLLPEPDLVVVTTPQPAAQRVAARTADVAAKTGMRIAGVVENMSFVRCTCCGEISHPFGSGGGRALAEELGAPLLAEIPLDEPLREASDGGTPLVVSAPEAESARAVASLAETLPGALRPRSGAERISRRLGVLS